MRVGLTGGIGSGKSSVAQLFSGWGAVVIDADELAREVVAPGTAGFAHVAALWPQAVNEQGSLDRAALAHIIFAQPAAREQLNGIVHPQVRARAAAIEAGLPPEALVVHVVPLLFEGTYWKLCARNVLVTAPQTVRLERVVRRDRMTAEQIQARMAAQIDPARAALLADFVIDNSGSFEVLAASARRIFSLLQRDGTQ